MYQMFYGFFKLISSYFHNPRDCNYGLVVLFLSDENSTYYEDQIITVPVGKCLKQVGTYRYMTRQNMEKTVSCVLNLSATSHLSKNVLDGIVCLFKIFFHAYIYY